MRSWFGAGAELECDVSFTTNKVREKMRTVKYRQLSPLKKGQITRNQNLRMKDNLSIDISLQGNLTLFSSRS